MVLIAEVNDHKRNMFFITDFIKDGEKDIIFKTSNGYSETETFDSKRKRDNAYDNLMDEFVLKAD